jgi:hypothetical protein
MVAANVSHIPEGGDFGILNFQLTMDKHRSTDFHFSTKPLFWVYAVIASASLKSKNMVKGQLKSGEKMFVVRTEHFVKLRDFARHLTEHFYTHRETSKRTFQRKKLKRY